MYHPDRRRAARDRIVDAEVMKLELRAARWRIERREQTKHDHPIEDPRRRGRPAER